VYLLQEQYDYSCCAVPYGTMMIGAHNVKRMRLFKEGQERSEKIDYVIDYILSNSIFGK